jgi:hypothetical protein
VCARTRERERERVSNQLIPIVGWILIYELKIPNFLDFRVYDAFVLKCQIDWLLVMLGYEDCMRWFELDQLHEELENLNFEIRFHDVFVL